jgi:hypothetical protein
MIVNDKKCGLNLRDWKKMVEIFKVCENGKI